MNSPELRASSRQRALGQPPEASIAMTPRIVAIVQARMNSSRLPGKVLLDIGGEPMLGRVVQRTSQSTLVEQVLVATTTDPTDDALYSYCTFAFAAVLAGKPI